MLVAPRLQCNSYCGLVTQMRRLGSNGVSLVTIHFARSSVLDASLLQKEGSTTSTYIGTAGVRA
jgi:hypothetical protein